MLTNTQKIKFALKFLIDFLNFDSIVQMMIEDDQA